MKNVMTIPKEIIQIVQKLERVGYEAYIVGGCVRDLLLGREPKDWDITTNAKPEDIQRVFPENLYENVFGTVGVKTGSKNEKLKVIEITTYRTEETYTDKRHPDKIEFTSHVEDDLARRDFTVNAMASKVTGKNIKSLETIIDPYGGQEDLKNKIVRTVGDQKRRFEEDALRLLRAPRLATELELSIEEKTAKAIRTHAEFLRAISKERIRDELEKLIMTERAAEGILLLEQLGLLLYTIPELREGIHVNQNKHHIFSVFEHNVKALEYAAKKNYPLDVRLAALLHDVAKPRTKRGEGSDCTFYGHQVVGERMAIEILDRLRFSKKTIERVALLIREHMFVYDIGEVSEAGVRRLVRRVGPENIEDLFRLREADRIGSGVPKARPYRLRHLKFMVEKVARDPISVGMLKVRGDDVMKVLKMEPGPRVGLLLNVLMGEVLEDPKLNTKRHLNARMKELNKLSDNELRGPAEKGKEVRSEREQEAEKKIKKKYWVQ